MRTGEVLAERFEIEKRAGSGGMGEVYRAVDRETGQRVAVKVLLDQHQEEARFFREARILAELRHPHIVQYVSRGVTAAGDPWLAMEWLDGEVLSARLSRGPLGPAESIVLATALAEALGFAHARGVVHRDLKPHNVFLVGGDAGQVKLLDFGIARREQATTMLTRTGGMLGTLGYMAPEQASGEEDLSARADVFSLGCVLYECLVGEPVFSGLHAMAILTKILLQQRPRLKDKLPLAPDDLDELLSRMLAKDPDERPADGYAAASALRALGELPAELRPTESPVVRAAALTNSEQRAVAVILIGAPGEAPAEEEPLGRKGRGNTALRFEAERHGGHFEPMFDRSAAVIMASTSVATDLAAQAVRCALALRAHAANRPIALTMVRGDVTTGQVPMGQAIDRAAKLVGGAQPKAPILLDDVVARLLDARFDAREAESGFVLLGERELSEGTRTLLGKATPCVGRERELRHLEEQFFDDCIDQSTAQAVLVTAPAGTGKSRLAHEFLRLVRDRDTSIAVWMGRGDSLRAGSAFGLLGQALRGACGVHDSEPLDVRRDKVRASIGGQIQEKDRKRVTEFLGEIIGTQFPADDSLQLRAARQDPQLMNDQMRAAFVEFLGAECTKHPVLIVLEDLHWGDRPTVQFIDSALRDLREKPFMVLALARPEVSDMFPKLWADRRFQQITLRQLNPKAIERLVRHVLGEKANVETVDRLARLSEGNAFYLEELIRWAAEGKTAELPETVVAMVQSRLAALDDGARRLLRAASIFGEVFWSGAVSSLLGGAEHTTQTRNMLTRLAERELITKRKDSRFPGEDEYAFRHALLREGAYAMLTDDDKTLGHQLAGAWLDAVGEADPAVRAEHFERGGERARAAELYAQAMEEALEAQDLAGVFTLAERAVACGASGNLLGTTRARQAEAHMWLGDYASAARVGQEAVALLPAGSPLWFCTVSNLALFGIQDSGQIERIVDELRRHGAVPQEASDAAMAAVAIAAYNFLLVGARKAAESLLEPLLTEEQTTSRPLAAGHISAVLSSFLILDGDLVAAAGALEAAIESLECTGAVRRTGLYRGDAMTLYFALGAFEAADKHAQSLLDGMKRFGLPYMEQGTEVWVMLGSLLRGALENAVLMANSLLPAILAGPYRMMLESPVRYVLAEGLQRAGDLDAAERELVQAVEVSAGLAMFRCMSLTALAALHLARGLPREARGAIEQAVRLLEPPCHVFVGQEAITRLVFAEVLHACGALDEAREAIAALRDFHQKRAAKMANPEVRRRYLDLPRNARALELAAAWLPA